MALERYLDLKRFLKVCGIIFVSASCGSQEAAVAPNQNTSITLPSQQLQEVRSQQQSNLEGSTNPKASGPLNFTYRTQSSAVTIPLDPSSQEFVLQLSGKPVVNDETTRWDDPAMIELRKIEVQKTIKYFVEAQELLYQGRYNEAMQSVNKSIEIAETAHALALKGTIHFMMGNSTLARAHWSKAVIQDPDIPLPSNMPELERMIQQVRGEM
jgi:tetratricopeptide (TPR) repeat protein